LAEGALPILDMIGPRNLAANERMYIERHELEGLAIGRRSHEFASRRTGGLSTDDDAIARDQNFLYLPFEVRNGLKPLGYRGQDFSASIAKLVSSAGDPLRRGRLLDEFWRLGRICGVQRLVEGC
jgi:hypothetical protein